MKNYTAENFIELLNKINFSNYQTFSCVNKAYLDFITKLITAIDTLCPSKKKKKLRVTQRFALILR